LVLHFGYRRRLKSLSAAFQKAMEKHDYLDDQCGIIVESACVTTQFWQMIAACTDFEASCASLIKSSETDTEKRRRLQQLSRDAEKLRTDFDEIYREAQRVAKALDALEEPLGTSDQLKENTQRLKQQVATQLSSAAELKDFLTQAVDRKFRDTLAKFAPPDT
jgi:DNA repair ATPase RecN